MLSVEQELTFLSSSVAHNLNSPFIAFDEVGRGPVFGPVTVTGVYFTINLFCSFSQHPFFMEINDSKKLLPQKRTTLYNKIIQCVSYKTMQIPAFWIDRYNINVAIQYAIYCITQFFIRKLRRSKDSLSILIDGNYNFVFPTINMPLAMPRITTKIKGDSLFFTLASASIIAKCTRDNLMFHFDKRNTGYNLKNNKGYLTKEHQLGIERFGITKYHRRSFLKNQKSTIKNW